MAARDPLESSKLDIVLEGGRGSIALSSFISALENARAIIAGVDVVVTHRKRATVEWYVEDLRMGSLQATLIAKPRTGRGAIEYSAEKAKQIASVVVDGFREVEARATVPDFFPDSSMRGLQRLGNLLKRNDASGFRVSSPGEEGEAIVTRLVAEHAKQALLPRYTATGSVLGRLDVISVHRGKQITVYDEIHHRPVRGTFPPELLGVVKEALSRRVVATGIIRRNTAHQMVSVQVTDLEILPDDASLPSVADLVGSDPDFTGGLPSDQWVRKVREA